MVIYGIDVSKNSLAVYSNSPVQFQQTIQNNLTNIEAFLLGIEKEAILCMEDSGLYCQLITHLAHQLQVKVALIDPYTLKHSIGNPKGKSDAIDAARIFEYALRFHDKLVYEEVDTVVFQEMKQLYNLRNTFTKQRQALLNINTNNKQLVACSLFGHTQLQETIAYLQEKILHIESELLQLVEADGFKQKMDNITSIKGVGVITALELLIVTGNFKKLTTAKKAAAYAGICPYPNQSGNKHYKSKHHPRSDRRLKALLFLCGRSACQWNKDYRQYKDRKLAEGKHYYLVMNNVANKLLRTIYALVEKNECYDYTYVQVDPRWEDSRDG